MHVSTRIRVLDIHDLSSFSYHPPRRRNVAGNNKLIRRSQRIAASVCHDECHQSVVALNQRWRPPGKMFDIFALAAVNQDFSDSGLEFELDSLRQYLRHSSDYVLQL